MSRQDRSMTAGTPDMSAFFGNDLCDLHHTYTKNYHPGALTIGPRSGRFFRSDLGQFLFTRLDIDIDKPQMKIWRLVSCRV